MLRPLALAAALAAASTGCGEAARPPVNRGGGGAIPEDVPPAYDAPDARPLPDRPSGCGGTRVSLARQRAEVVLVVDRSGSMREPDNGGRAKWTSLVEVLRDLLPRVEADVAAGLVFFPVAQTGSGAASVVCGVPASLEAAPAFRNASALLRVLAAASPGGGTPTHGALELVARHFDRSPDPLGRRYVVLATDGAPNCNLALDPRTCVCAGPANTCAPSDRGPVTNCLDDARTLEAIRALARRGVDTFVVGLVGVESFASVLDAMAVAGGRAREGSPRYYAAGDREALAAALGGITDLLVDCRFRLDAPPPDPDLVDVRLAGTSLVRDPSRRDGWDWSDDAHTEVAFHGLTCDRVRSASGGEVLAAVFGCPAPAPP